MLENTTLKQRDIKFDILRGIGILLMIMGHSSFCDHFNHYIHAFHMPIFFFVSGYFFNGEKYENIWGHVKHDLRTLILPYVVFFSVCQILHYIYVQDFTWEYSIISFFSSNHNRIDVSGVCWFLLCLFMAKQIFLLLYKFCNKTLLGILIVIITLIGNVLRYFIKLPLCLDSAMSAMLLIYLGYLYRNNTEKPFIKKMMNLPLWAIIIGLIANGALIFLNGGVNLRTNYYAIIPLYWLNALTAIYLLLQLSSKMVNCKFKIVKCLSNAFCYLGKNSITFLVLNELAIFGFDMVFKFIGLHSVIPNLLLRFIVFIVAILSLIVANEIFSRTPLKVLIGKKITKREIKNES